MQQPGDFLTTTVLPVELGANATSSSAEPAKKLQDSLKKEFSDAYAQHLALTCSEVKKKDPNEKVYAAVETALSNLLEYEQIVKDRQIVKNWHSDLSFEEKKVILFRAVRKIFAFEMLESLLTPADESESEDEVEYNLLGRHPLATLPIATQTEGGLDFNVERGFSRFVMLMIRFKKDQNPVGVTLGGVGNLRVIRAGEVVSILETEEQRKLPQFFEFLQGDQLEHESSTYNPEAGVFDGTVSKKVKFDMTGFCHSAEKRTDPETQKILERSIDSARINTLGRLRNMNKFLENSDSGLFGALEEELGEIATQTKAAVRQLGPLGAKTAAARIGQPEEAGAWKDLVRASKTGQGAPKGSLLSRIGPMFYGRNDGGASTSSQGFSAT